jgi:hypothetical protein
MTISAEPKARDLTWEYPRQDGQPFVLHEGGVEVGHLVFRKEPEASEAEFAGQKWVFHYTTTLRPHVRIFLAGSERPVAEYTPSLQGGGEVAFDSGETYRWKKSHLFGEAWRFGNPGRKSCVCVEQESGRFTQGGRIALCCRECNLPDRPALVLLAWFLRILDFEMLVEGMFGVG